MSASVICGKGKVLNRILEAEAEQEQHYLVQ